MSAVAGVRVSSGALEAIKWAALACMLVDHVNAVFYGRELGLWADVLGRIAMPLFAGVFGYNLARPGVDVARVLRRLVFFGLLAAVPHAALFGILGPWPLNILATFAVAAWVVLELEAGRTLLAFGVFLAGGALVEYWWPGVALVLACWAAARSPRPGLGDLAAVGLALAGLCVLVNGSAYGLLAVPLALLLVVVRPELPRLRWLFWWFYPVHLVVLAILRFAWRS